MGRLVTVSIVTALLSGCGGGVATQSAIGPLPSLGTQSRVAAPNANCPASPGGSGLLSDGDFSQAPNPGTGQQGLRKGTVFAPDWINSGPHTIDFYGPGWSFWQPPNGLCNVDLDGTPGPGGIKHSTFSITKGVNYAVGFLFSGNGACPPTVKTMTVLADGQFARLTWDTSNGNDAEHGHWTKEAWRFTALHGTANLVFQSNDPPGNCGAIVAGISLTKI
jgi:hypothetical protein